MNTQTSLPKPAVSVGIITSQTSAPGNTTSGVVVPQMPPGFPGFTRPPPPLVIPPGPFPFSGVPMTSQHGNLILPSSINFSMPPPGWVPPPVHPVASNPQQASSSVWVENKSTDGQVYYYHSKTRETTWTKPADVKIITQAEFANSIKSPSTIQSTMFSEAKLNAVSVTGDGTPAFDGHEVTSPNEFNKTEGSRIEEHINANAQCPQIESATVIETSTVTENKGVSQKSNDVDTDTAQLNSHDEDMSDAIDASQATESVSLQATGEQGHLASPITVQNCQVTTTEDSSTSISVTQPATAETNGNKMSHFPSIIPQNPLFTLPPSPIMPIPPNLTAHHGPPPPWIMAPGGKPIPPPWWPANLSNPPPLVPPPPPVNLALKANNSGPDNSDTCAQNEIEKIESERQQQLVTVNQLKQKANEWTKHTSPEGREYFYSSSTMQSQWTKPKELQQYEESEVQLKCIEEKLAQLRVRSSCGVSIANVDANQSPIPIETIQHVQTTTAHQSLNTSHTTQPQQQPSEEELARLRNRPVSNIPVPGSPWCVVWTSNSRVFFFNPTQKLSVWERPAELQGRPDVDKMVTESPPEVLAIVAQKRKAEMAKIATDDDEIDQKKARPHVNEANEADLEESTIEASKEAALEAELKASKERSQIPYELRSSQFRAMLLEKGVSAFSTWEKELHKIVFDRRYLLLASKERKTVFDRFVKERAEEERNEKATKMKEIRDNFKALLKETVTKSSITFSEFASKNAKDDRFRAIEKMRDREALFMDYMTKLKRREREERYNDLERLRRNFWDLLREKAVGSSSITSRWSDVRRLVENDYRYRAVESTSRREDWFKEYLREQRESLRSRDDLPRDDRQARIDASIRKRHEEVKEQLSESLRDREKEREQLRKTEAIENFQVLLMDMVRTVENDWKQTKRTLKKDCRWDLCKLLGKEEKENLFDQHISALIKKKKDSFYQLLDETGEVTLTSKWKSIKKVIKSDIRYERFGSSEKAKEKEFAQYIKEKYTQAKEDLKQLLAESIILNHKTMAQIRESEQSLTDIEEHLSKDKRFIMLECVPEERRKILLDFLYELEFKGPPPPPTATEPIRRK